MLKEIFIFALVAALVAPLAVGVRTEINATSLVMNGEPVAVATATALDSTNNHTIAWEEGLVLRVVESGGVEGNTQITVKAGDNPPAFRASLGDLVVNITNATSETLIGPFESARFINQTGYLLVNTNTTDGTIEGFILP
jgi:hypothetical protein